MAKWCLDWLASEIWTQQRRAGCGSFSHRSGRLPGRVNPLKLKGRELVASTSVFTGFVSIDSNWFKLKHVEWKPAVHRVRVKNLLDFFILFHRLKPISPWSKALLWWIRCRQMQCLQSPARPLGIFGLSNEVAYLLRSVSSFKQMLLSEQSCIRGCLGFETSIISWSSFLNWPPTLEETPQDKPF